MTRSARSLTLRLLALVACAAGCNTILDNQRGRLDDGAGAESATEPTPGDAIDTPAAEDDEGGASCAPGEKRCDGACVGEDDPAYGCARAGCAPCKARRGSSVCEGGACAVAACDDGYADCNADPSDGCESDLSKAQSCGACGAACPPTLPVCAPAGATFECTTGCAPAAPLLCGTECVSPLTSVNHCGGCGGKCAEVANGEPACVGGICTVACDPGFHACAGACVAETDPNACGPTCAVCPAAANAVAACEAGACGLTCKAGFADCNADPADGCEAKLATDPLHCGACNTVCVGGACVGGACGLPPPGPPL